MGRMCITEIESISKWRSQNHQECENVFECVWPKRSSERLGGCPESWVGEYTLSMLLLARTTMGIAKAGRLAVHIHG